MLLMRGYWQLADMRLCISKVPVLLKVSYAPTPVICVVVLPNSIVRQLWIPLTLRAEIENLSVVQAMGRPTAEILRHTLPCGCEFVIMMRDAGTVTECSVPPGEPSMTVTILAGFVQLGTILQSCAADR
jgi:hypothetical protein